MEALKTIAAHFAREDERQYLALLDTVAHGNNFWPELRTMRAEAQRAVDEGHVILDDLGYMTLTTEGESYLMSAPKTTAIRQMGESLV